MVESIRSLERKLNKKIDNELKKEVSQIDDKLIMGCCDALLMMDDVNQYIITESEKKNIISNIVVAKTKTVRKMAKPIKILLVAAIIIILLAVGTFGYAQYKYNIFNFSDHSAIFFSQSDIKEVDKLKIEYIPEGFTLSYESDNKQQKLKEYVNGDNYFAVTKLSGFKEIKINTEYGDSKITQISGIDYVEYGDVEHGQGVVWEKNGYQYTVSGNIPAQELLKIAVSVE